MFPIINIITISYTENASHRAYREEDLFRNPRHLSVANKIHEVGDTAVLIQLIAKGNDEVCR